MTTAAVSGTGSTTGVVEPVVRAYRVVLDPTPAQAEALERHAGAARAAFNHALAAKVAAHRLWRQEVAFATYDVKAPRDIDLAVAWARKQVKVKTPSAYDCMRSFKADEKNDWYPEVSLRAIEGGLAHADAAWKNWLDSLTGRRAGRRVGYPRFKSRRRSTRSFRLVHDVKKPTLRPDGYRRLNLPAKVGGSVRLKGNIRQLARRIRKGIAVIASVTISRHGHRWVASILARETVTLPSGPSRAQQSAGTVGVDVGVKVMAALSTGELIPNPRTAKRAERRVRKAQQALSRTGWYRESDGALIHDVKTRVKRQPTAGREAAQRRLARAQALVAEQRSQGLHRFTKRLATGWAVVGVEDLNVAGMTRSARGTLEAPGTNVAAKTGLNRAILDVAFGELRRQLAYKTSWYGSRLVTTPRFAPTSKTCSACGWRDPSQTLADRTFRCAACGQALDRDVNAARNIARLAAGQPLPTPAGNPAPDPATAARHVAPENEETRNARGAPGRTTRPRVGTPEASKREDPPAGGPPRPSNRPPIPPTN